MKARTVTLGSTGITVVQNGFGALPIQRDNMDEAVRILRRAYEGGMRFFDTARAYSDSEEKLGEAFGDMGIRENIIIATKTGAKTPEVFWEHLHTSLRNLRTDYIDIYQLHMAQQCYRPGDGTGMYEALCEAKEKGLIRHIGITAHKIGVAEEIVESGLYETLQFPFSYLASERDIRLVRSCKEHNMGFIAMKGLAGGLINRSDAAFAFMTDYDNVIPIWGVQRMNELEEWLSYMEDAPTMTDEIRAFIEQEQAELAGNFCRGCGYCMPCPAGISINNCARMSLMVRRAPSANWLNEYWQEEMKKIENCLHCKACTKRCPYELDTPTLLEKNYEDYKKILAGEVSADSPMLH
ncbi:MAG: aldo/keto reductase [Lachnospiraceae bacterium]|nr:aldo/keto reductase [Lachnospiraceae bacterium]